MFSSLHYAINTVPSPATFVVVHAASHVDHEQWVSISMRACGSLPIVIVLRLTELRYDAARNVHHNHTVFTE